MPITRKPKKKASTAKRTTRKKTSGGIASYVRKVQNSPTVKAATKMIKDLEKRLAAAKKEKATKVKAVQRKLKK